MIPNDILLYPSIYALFSYHWRASFFNRWEQIERFTAGHYVERDLGTVSTKGMCLPNPSPQTLGQGGHKSKSQRIWRSQRKQGSLTQHDQSSHEITEAETACKGPARGCHRFFVGI